VGSLDLECDESLSLGMTKDMICVPIILSMRSEVRYDFDKAWHHLSTTDTAIIQYSARIQSSVSAKAGDPDDLKITFKILMKILKETSFSKYIDVGARFGKKGTNSTGFIIFHHVYFFFVFSCIMKWVLVILRLPFLFTELLLCVHLVHHNLFSVHILL
jgi:hypothetical protein